MIAVQLEDIHSFSEMKFMWNTNAKQTYCVCTHVSNKQTISSCEINKSLNVGNEHFYDSLICYDSVPLIAIRFNHRQEIKLLARVHVVHATKIQMNYIRRQNDSRSQTSCLNFSSRRSFFFRDGKDRHRQCAGVACFQP